MRSRRSSHCRLATLSGCCIHASALLLSSQHITVIVGCRDSSRTVCFDKPNKKNEYETVDLDSVTDAEALLACRAYLQRKNRLNAWKNCQRRKESLRQASSVGSTFASESVGYFWENPEELIYLNDHDREDSAEDENEEVTPEGRVVFENTEQQEGVTMMLGRNVPALEQGTEFRTFPTLPSVEHVRRSNAAKKTWDDPKWKEMWYEKRWGRLRHQSPYAAKLKRLDERVRSMPPSLFETQELPSLSEEEIVEAIRTYVVSNRKRSKAHTKDARQRRRNEKNESVNRGKSKIDVFFDSNDAKKEAQQKRAERAVKAYQTRLANLGRLAPTETKHKRTHDSLPTSNTPKDALVRIQAHLESNVLPPISDVELILKPPKLGRRKDLLRRILNEHFNLRGKCVPVDSTKEMLFVTQCSIEELGAFVLQKMQERLTRDSSMSKAKA